MTNLHIVFFNPMDISLIFCMEPLGCSIWVCTIRSVVPSVSAVPYQIRFLA